MRISFVHTKGGVGKTTCTIMLAIAAHRRGIKVEVFDADPQASTTRWAQVAISNDDPLEFPVTPITATKLRRLPTVDDGWQIIDTPPGNAKEIQAAIDTSDLVIVPTQPSALDIDRVWPTLETLNHRMVGVLIVRGQKRRRLFNETREIFESQGVATFYHYGPDREEIKALFGTNPQNLFTFDDIAQEILEIPEEAQ